MARAIKFQLAGLSDRATGIYVTVWRFTSDVWMLLLRKKSRHDSKLSIITLWKYASTSYVSPRFCGFRLAILFKRRPEPVIFNLILKVTLCLTELFLKIDLTGCSGSLLRISVIIFESFFSPSFPIAFDPVYKRGLTKRKNRLKKDPMLLPSALWN